MSNEGSQKEKAPAPKDQSAQKPDSQPKPIIRSRYIEQGDSRGVNDIAPSDSNDG